MWCCVPSRYFGLRQNYGESNGSNGDLFQKTYASTMWLPGLLKSVPLTLQHVTVEPCFHQRLLDTHRQLWLHLLWGHCSFLLGPGAHKVLFMPSKGQFSQSYVSSGSSMVGLMAAKRVYAIPRSAAPRASAPAAVHC